MKRFLLFFIVAVSFNATAQQISQSVIASSGGNFSAGGYSLSSTTGEMSMITTFTQSNAILSQGFHPGELFFTGIDDPENSNNVLLIYPNPAGDILNVLFNSKDVVNAKLSVYDLLGQQTVVSKTFETSGFSRIAVLNTSDLQPGIYFLNIEYSNNSSKEKTTTSRFIIQR